MSSSDCRTYRLWSAPAFSPLLVKSWVDCSCIPQWRLPLSCLFFSGVYWQITQPIICIATSYCKRAVNLKNKTSIVGKMTYHKHQNRHQIQNQSHSFSPKHIPTQAREPARVEQYSMQGISCEVTNPPKNFHSVVLIFSDFFSACALSCLLQKWSFQLVDFQAHR